MDDKEMLRIGPEEARRHLEKVGRDLDRDAVARLAKQMRDGAWKVPEDEPRGGEQP